MLVTIVAGARPNFIKIAPIISAIEQAKQNGKNLSYRLVHTGQHYDKKMSDDFFIQLGIPSPDNNLGAGGGTQAEQTAAIMIGFEKELNDNRPDLVLVVGDVTSTMACSIVAKKLNNIKVAHVEAGIRSCDMTMPEEINRIVTDSITDYFFTTSHQAGDNLKKAGVPQKSIFFVGNTMIDTLYKQMPNFKKPKLWDELALQPEKYVVLTLHRPANVDEPDKLVELITAIATSAPMLSILFPIHPRTAKILSKTNLSIQNLHIIEPLSYLEFNYLVKHSKVVVTDSGGITEETTVMGIPCMTLRNNTERPETVLTGTNELLGTDASAIKPAFDKLLIGGWKEGAIPEKWDGKTSQRIVDHLLEIFDEKA